MALPFLPGNSPSKALKKERFHKSQHFDYSGGVPMLVGSGKPGIGGEPLLGQKMATRRSAAGGGGGLPSWVAFDKQALCFEAYFQEAVTEAQNETYRIRRCNIIFYLEDDSIQVVEPQYKNSGIPQGTFIHRQRIPLPPPDEEQFYNVFHFNLNQQMVLYSRTFTVCNCDSFTRNFLAKLGVRLNDPIPVPEDPYSNFREETEKSIRPLRPYERYDTLKQFLEHDPKVLRFYCFWDDTESMFGDLRELVLHYFLADDTIEIREVSAPNSGREPIPKFLRRSKLPKRCPSQMKLPGEITDRTVLNVFTFPSTGSCYILDNLRTGAVHEDFYKDYDLCIGGEVNVWGRRVIIAGCDDFTKEYYRANYGLEDFTPVQYKTPKARKPQSLVPPYNGFGSEEDSLSSCRGLLLKPPQKDFQKFMEKDRCGLNSNVLNFRAKMVTTDPVDSKRRFIISFYLSNDSISVFERPQRNSGVMGGKFLERARVKKPGQELFKSELSQYYTAQDLYVGATLCLSSKDFQLLEGDEYTLQYMEQHAEEFPKSNVGIVLSKLRSIPEEKQSEVRKFLILSDPSSTGFVSYESFRGLLVGLDCGLSEHEVLVLGRQFSVHEEPEADVGLMLAVVQDLLRKKPFEEFPDLIRAFRYLDQYRTGRLSTKDTRTICKSFQIPLPDNLLGALLRKFADGDEIDYHAFVAAVNWLENPAPPVLPEDTLKFEVSTRLDTDVAAEKRINYAALLDDVFSFSSSHRSAAPAASGGDAGPPADTYPL